LILPQWIFDSVACSVMREVAAPVSCLGALEELRRLLQETRVLDVGPASGETGALLMELLDQHAKTAAVTEARRGSDE
jgi:hypothetical protein